MTPRFNLFIAIVALAIGVPYYWFLIDNSHAERPAHRIDLNQLRQLAASIPGPAPVTIAVERAASRRLPGNFMAAGSGLKRRLTGIMAFRLSVPGRAPILIESGITRQTAERIAVEQFVADGQASIERTMDEAAMILVTHEHADHMGALAAHGGPALYSAARLNPMQASAKADWKDGKPPLPLLTGKAYEAVAPGIVVIPAPNSHTPGSQIVYVRLADAREYLFVGDLSSFTANWNEQRGRSRLVQQWIAPENRDEVYAWLAAIQEAKRENPGLVIVPGHDYEWIVNPENKTGIRDSFTLPGN